MRGYAFVSMDLSSLYIYIDIDVDAEWLFFCLVTTSMFIHAKQRRSTSTLTTISSLYIVIGVDADIERSCHCSITMLMLT